MKKSVLTIIDEINSPKDVKQLSVEQMNILAQDIRKGILNRANLIGGPFSSELGMVEPTIALHYVFDSPKDKFIFDTSHQTYAHKMLTGRYSEFESLRTKDGLSGFTRINESEHDYFDAGHASSSISSALGLLASWKIQGRKDKVIAVIDGIETTIPFNFKTLYDVLYELIGDTEFDEYRQSVIDTAKAQNTITYYDYAYRDLQK